MEQKQHCTLGRPRETIAGLWMRPHWTGMGTYLPRNLAPDSQKPTSTTALAGSLRRHPYIYIHSFGRCFYPEWGPRPWSKHKVFSLLSKVGRLHCSSGCCLPHCANKSIWLIMFVQKPQGEPHFKSSVCFLELQEVCSSQPTVIPTWKYRHVHIWLSQVSQCSSRVITALRQFLWSWHLFWKCDHTSSAHLSIKCYLSNNATLDEDEAKGSSSPCLKFIH